jgi:hypothetical protein
MVGMNQPTNQPTNQPEPADTLTTMLQKAIAAERNWIVVYLRKHSDMSVTELATAIDARMHQRIGE